MNIEDNFIIVLGIKGNIIWKCIYSDNIHWYFDDDFLVFWYKDLKLVEIKTKFVQGVMMIPDSIIDYYKEGI